MSDWLVKKRTQLSGGKREELARRLRIDYEAGATIRALSEENERSYGSVRRLLLESGATLRKRGGDTRDTAHERPAQQRRQSGPHVLSHARP